MLAVVGVLVLFAALTLGTGSRVRGLSKRGALGVFALVVVACYAALLSFLIAILGGS
jgi:hypothetical protein